MPNVTSDDKNHQIERSNSRIYGSSWELFEGGGGLIYNL